MVVRPIQPDDQELLYDVYASTREEELAAVAWEDGQKEALPRQQFTAQHAWYQENYAGAEFLVILRDGVPAGRRGPGRRARTRWRHCSTRSSVNGFRR